MDWDSKRDDFRKLVVTVLEAEGVEMDDEEFVVLDAAIERVFSGVIENRFKDPYAGLKSSLIGHKFLALSMKAIQDNDPIDPEIGADPLEKDILDLTKRVGERFEAERSSINPSKLEQIVSAIGNNINEFEDFKSEFNFGEGGRNLN